MSKHNHYAQLHLHTKESSRCGISSGGEMARACKAAGYSTIVVTDHFMNANIGCPKDMPWKDKVHYLFAGYRAAKDVGDRIGLTVLKGWETYNNGPEFLTYGLDEAFLLDNPDIADVPAQEYLRRVREAGGFVIHAHPYREAYYIPPFAPITEDIDGWEVLNAAHVGPDASFNHRALVEAHRKKMPMFAGSDAHSVNNVAGGAMKLPHHVRDMDSLIEVLKSGKCKIVDQM